MMIVVVTGMVGVDKKSYLQNVCQLGAERGKEVLLCNVGDMMYAEAPDIPNGKILDISMKRLHSLRRSVFKDSHLSLAARPVPGGGLRPDAPAQSRYVYLPDRRHRGPA
jgi:hypothetical protein